MKKAAIRKLKEELGINIKSSDLKFLTTEETIFRGKSIPANRHTINNSFLVNLKSPEKFKLDSQTPRIVWFSKIDKKWHPYVKDILRLAGFK